MMLKGSFFSLMDLLPEINKFYGKISRETEVRGALDYFIDTAIFIRSRPRFTDSIFHKLDKLLANVGDYVCTNFRNVTNIEAIRTEGTFIALSAPSMDGKTQSAFVFRLVKPLYFPLSGVRSAGAAAQPIYKNFSHLSDAIVEYSSLDLTKIRSIDPEMGVLKFNEFNDRLERCEFWTLGFLCHLVEDGRNISGDNWMRYHAERPNFEFRARSIESIEEGFFNGFFLFLDEFIGSDEGLFIRDLARVSNLTCLVANTNTRISNLTKGSTSGGNGANIWSIVASQLNLPDNYSDIYNLNAELETFLVRGQGDHRIELFISDFISNQAKYLRPGVARFVKDGLSKLNTFLRNNTNQELNIRLFMDCIVRSLRVSLLTRKPSIASGIIAHWAKIGLLFPTVYKFSDLSVDSDDRNLHHLSFLESHLYHLINPTNRNDWLFMTFAPLTDGNDLRLEPPNSVEWSDQLTYFKEEELFTILGCLWMPFSQAVTTALKKARRRTATDLSANADMPNENAFKLPGNTLEISALVSIIDSTHHFFACPNPNSLPENTFAGQNGNNFIKNIIVNLIEDTLFTKKMNILISISHQVLIDFLSRCHVPYLYAINREIDILENISDLGSSVFFGSLTRPEDDEQIDGHFSFKLESSYALMTVECKNIKKQMTSNILYTILEKSIAKSAKVCLVFCNEFIENPSSRSKFTRLCTSNFINVYRIRRNPNAQGNVRSYTVQQFSNLVFNDPQSICILFESKRVNVLAPKNI